MKRKLTPSECLFISNSSSAFHILVQVQLDHVLGSDELAKAMKALQDHLPALFVRIEDGHLVPGTARPASHQVKRVEEANINCPTVLAWLHQIVSKPWDLRRDPPIQVLLVQDAHRSLLALLLHHGICDGKSATTILNQVLTGALGGHKASEASVTRAIPLSLEDLFEISVPGDFAPRILTRNAEEQPHIPELGLDHVIWSSAHSERLKTACRCHGFSLHSAFLAAASRALRSLAQERELAVDRFQIHFPINVRDKLGLHPDEIGNLICFAQIEEGGTHPECMLEHARLMHREIQDRISRERLHQAAQEISAIGQQHQRENAYSGDREPQPLIDPEVHVMNLGSLSQLAHPGMRALSIANYFAPRFFAEHQLAVMAFLWQDRLHFIIHFARDHGDSFAQAFGQRFSEDLQSLFER
jgi:hypothetical protein